MPNQSDWCAVEGCGKPSHAKGFCNTHYAQYLRDKANDPKPRGGRRANGTFAPGVSPNPGGRPAGFGDFTRMYREEVPANRKKLRALRDDPKVPPAVQLNAVKEMHDRAYGRSVVPVLQGVRRSQFRRGKHPALAFRQARRGGSGSPKATARRRPRRFARRASGVGRGGAPRYCQRRRKLTWKT